MPPPKEGLVDGREFILVADRLPSISDQSPVYYHGVQVGEVTGHEIALPEEIEDDWYK